MSYVLGTGSVAVKIVSRCGHLLTQGKVLTIGHSALVLWISSACSHSANRSHSFVTRFAIDWRLLEEEQNKKVNSFYELKRE